MELTVQFDTAQLGRLNQLARTAPDIFAQSLRAALRRAGQNMRKTVRSGIKGASYLKTRDIAAALGSLKITSDEAMLTVAGARKAGHKFRMSPNRVTARQGQRSVNWKAPLVKIGPGEPDMQPRRAGFSKPFIIRNKSGLKAMYWREKATNRLSMPPIVSPQYFAAFDRVKEPVMAEAEATFLKRLEHEIDYRLGLGK